MSDETTHEMQAEPSLIPDNSYENDNNDENDNRMTIGGPSMRPRPQPKRALTPAEIKTQEKVQQRSHHLTQKLVAAQMQHSWRNTKLVQRIQNTLANDTVIRNFVFSSAKGGEIAFVSLPPRKQLRVLKKVDRDLRAIAQKTANAMQQTLAPNPNDPTNLSNQANPYNLANQYLAAQQTNVIKQGNQQEQMILTQDNQQAQIILTMDNQVTEEQQQEEQLAENNQAAMILTEAELADVALHNEKEYTFNPTPEPEHQANDEALKEGEKIAVEDIAAKEILEHRGEAKALEGFMHKEKSVLMEGMQGMESKVDHAVEKVGLEVGMRLVSAAAGG